MTNIFLDANLHSKLLNLNQPLEICDETGRVLGRFTPVADLPNSNGIQPQLTEDQLLQRAQEPGYSTAEVLAYLGKL